MKSLDKIVALSKRRGFVYPGSDIYGGFGGTWDYGPLGVELKNNIKKAFWKSMVYDRDDVVGIDSSILMNPKVWEASGHVKAFTDPLTECKICNKRLRADHKIEIIAHEKTHKGKKAEWTKPKQFNLLVEAKVGVVEGAKIKTYLRGEITQGVHVNFKNIINSTRAKIPFGVAQIGKAFRNEITPGNFTFRSREFEQMELQFYIKPEDKESKKWFEYWKEQRMKWYVSLGLNRKKLRFRRHEENERAHYAKDAWDIEYDSPFGWKEFEGIHHRGDWDVSQHQKHSKEDLTYFDQKANKHYLPYIIETSGGVDRVALFILVDSYREENGRTYLKLHPMLSPKKAAVFPLLPNKPELVKKARELYKQLKDDLSVPIDWDDRGNIGKRYLAQDEAGTPFCITVDFDSLKDQAVTVRDRNTTKQERIKISKISAYLSEKLK